MPTDSDTRTVVVAAPFETVLATIRDVDPRNIVRSLLESIPVQHPAASIRPTVRPA